jgi:Transglutaminase-like superfamily
MNRDEMDLPAPVVELAWWPCARPIVPLELTRLNRVGEAMVRARLSKPLPSALATAEQLLAWVTNRWRHSTTTYFGPPDANNILDRVAAGGRFDCVEYTIVLSQALNAMEIPARRLDLYAKGYHARADASHHVTEAWIDDLGKWILLDGRNGATWRDRDGAPLSALELQRRFQAGDMPEFAGTGRNFDAAEGETWFSYFSTVVAKDGLAWSDGSYVPVLADGTVIRSSRLADSDVDVAPDLSAISTSVTDRGGAALVFHTDHPYATGFEVTDTATKETTLLATGEALPLAGEPGDQRLTVSVTTRYGSLSPRHLHYVIR